MSKQCHYCGSTMALEKDHKIPYSRGGVSWILACRKCNRSKSDNTPAEWLDRIIKSSDSSDKYRWKMIKEWNYGRSNWFAQLVHTRERRGY